MRLANKIKVLLLSPLPPPTGGIAKWTLNLLNYFSYNKITNVAHLNTAIGLKRVTLNSGSRRLISGILNFVSLFFRLLIHLVADKPDVIHLTSCASFRILYDCTFVTIAKLLHIPVITHWRFGRIPLLASQQNWEWKLLSYVINNSYTTIVIDKKSYDTLINAGFKNVKNIPNPISLFVEKKVKIFLKQTFKRPNGKIIFVGQVRKSKGIFELVEACLNNPYIKELVIVGPYEEDLKIELLKMANQRENGTWINLIGQLDENQVLEQMSKSSILALPSYSEGFPNVVIEAMAMGCAIIATDVGAIPEMIDSKSESPCGICVPVKDIEVLKIAIDDLIQNPVKAQKMGKRGIEKVLNNYTLANVIIQYQKLWEDASKNEKK